MRKAGEKEGLIGSKGAVDVNQSPVSVALTGRQSNLMIKFCTCTERSSSSSLRNLSNYSDSSMTCKGCTGESTTERGGPSCSSKLNNMRLELPRPIDLEVRWKTVNRRQRATRRARTSFSGGDRMKDDMRSFYAFGNFANEMTQEDAPVSDSEKLGVSILGRRFSDSMENIPIKKRRFQMDFSPSPPPTPLLVDPYEKILRSSSGGISSRKKQRKGKMLGRECKEENKGPLDADFSGISILAAAACESELDGDLFNGQCTKLTHPQNSVGSIESSLLYDRKGDILEDSHRVHDSPLEPSNSAPDMKPSLITTLTSSGNLFGSASTPKVTCSLYSASSSANKTEIISDAKSSSAAMPIGSRSADTSVGCFQDAVAHTKCDNATRDSRLHWDLNVAMEAWDTDCGDYDDPTIATVSGRNDAEVDMNTPQTPHDLFGSTVGGDVPNISVDKIHMVDVPKGLNAEDEGDYPTDRSSHPLRHQPSQNLQLLKSESVRNDTPVETMELPDHQQKGGVDSVVELLHDSNQGPAIIMEHLPLNANVEKVDGLHPPPVDYEGLSHMSSMNGHVGGNSVLTSELGSTLKPLANRLVSEESTNLPTVTALHKEITDFGRNDNKLEEASEENISEFKNQELLDVDSGTSKMDQSVSEKDEHDADVLYATKSTADAENLSHPDDNPGSSGCDMAHIHEEDGADAMINSKDCLVTCANSSSAETYYISGVPPQTPGLSSEFNNPGVTDAGSIVDSEAAAHSYQNGYKKEPGKIASEVCLERCYETDISHINKSVAVFGKVDVEEEDSQYEDGELRESGDRYWVDDAYEEVRCTNWQCEVANDKSEAATPGIPPHPTEPVSKKGGIPAARYNGAKFRKEDEAVSPVSSKRSWSTNCLDGRSSAGGNAHSIHSRVTVDPHMYEINPGRVTAGSAAVSQSERCNDGGVDLLSTAMKNTRWDIVPEDQRHSRCDPRDAANFSNRCVLSSLDAAGGDQSLRKIGLPTRDVQPAERPRSFDRPHMNELSRSDDGYSSGSRVERTIDSHRSQGIYDASRHTQTCSRGEQWVENPKHPRSTRRKSPVYFNYGASVPRNAAEATVAKMESNGFVVAPDGTLVRSGDAANAGHMARRMKNALSSSYRPLSGRGSPIDRDGPCGLSRGSAHAREASSERHFGVSSNRSGRYGPEMEKDHTTDGVLSSVRCSLSSRQRGIPPGRAALNLSHARSRSPSGSRSRSPNDWTSRNRRKIVTNGGSTLQRHSRSPHSHMAKARMGRMTSPQRQPGYDDRGMRYSSPPRNHTYTQHASTWVDGRNVSTADLPDQNRRYSRRSPPPRTTSRNDRFDVMESQGRSRSREFYRPTQGRLPYGCDKELKHAGNGDDREYVDRYGSHSVKPYDQHGAVKQFRNNTGDKFRTRISAPRSPELQRRVSPRRFDRNFKR